MLKIKTLSIALFATFFAFSAMAQVSMGLTATALTYDASGNEKMKSSGNKTNKDASGEAGYASIFIEYTLPTDTVIGIDVMPYSQKIGDGTNSVPDTDVSDDADTAGTNKTDVNMSGHAMIYIEQPIDADFGFGMPFVKIGFSQMTLETDESVATGSTYGDETMDAFHVGVGLKGDLDDGFWKLGLTYGDYDGATFVGSEDVDSVSNTITLEEMETLSLSLSIGQSF
tara:strand:- start:1363 stop:2043 length:681 start_codon:yes stop_codon:yes gene_type:complete